MNKVLVIDDEKATLTMFRLFLSAYGYTVFIAENGIKGIEIFEKEKPSIVFTDIKMPVMDGLEVLKKIKGINPDTEVIVITGHGDIDLAVKALNLDATDYINKPIKRTALDVAFLRAEKRIKNNKENVNNISVKVKDNIATLHLTGNVYNNFNILFKEEYDKSEVKNSKNILIHFNDNFSINGDGIYILINFLKTIINNGQNVAVSGIAENFMRIFEMVGISRVAAVYENKKDALENF